MQVLNEQASDASSQGRAVQNFGDFDMKSKGIEVARLN